MSALASNRVTIPHIWELRLCAKSRHPSITHALCQKETFATIQVSKVSDYLRAADALSAISLRS